MSHKLQLAEQSYMFYTRFSINFTACTPTTWNNHFCPLSSRLHLVQCDLRLLHYCNR